MTRPTDTFYIPRSYLFLVHNTGSGEFSSSTLFHKSALLKGWIVLGFKIYGESNKHDELDKHGVQKATKLLNSHLSISSRCLVKYIFCDQKS